MHSAIDALTRLFSDITFALNRKVHCICVFFYMETAYDTVCRFGIVQILYEAGVRGEITTFIRNILSNRVFRTKIGVNFSCEHSQLAGVPQGSVLSCTVFALAMNGISLNLPPDAHYNLYVDYFLLNSLSNYVSGLKRLLQVAINNISRWSEYHGFKFSPIKTVAVHFNKKGG